MIEKASFKEDSVEEARKRVEEADKEMKKISGKMQFMPRGEQGKVQREELAPGMKKRRLLGQIYEGMKARLEGSPKENKIE